MNGKPEMAWKIYMDMDTSSDAIKLLSQVANDCYRRGFFFYSLKCFDILSRLDSDVDNQYYQAKIGASVGSRLLNRRFPDGHRPQGLQRPV
jgi:intraflagellar transport protein 56